MFGLLVRKIVKPINNLAVYDNLFDLIIGLLSKESDDVLFEFSDKIFLVFFQIFESIPILI